MLYNKDGELILKSTLPKINMLANSTKLNGLALDY